MILAKNFMVCLAVIGILCVRSIPALAQQLDSRIESALRANAKALSGLEFEGYQERRFLIEPSIALEELQTLETEKGFIERVPFVLKLQHEKFYKSLKFPAGRYNSGTCVNEQSFDGNKLFMGNDDPEGNRFTPGILSIRSKKTVTEEFARKFSWKVPPAVLPYLSAAGYSGSLLPEDLGSPIRSLVLYRIDSGTLVSSSPLTQGSKPFVEVVVRYPDPWASTRPPSTHSKTGKLIQNEKESLKFQRSVEEMNYDLFGVDRYSSFKLDPALNFAVVEIREWRDAGAPLHIIKCSEFVKVKGSASWLPKQCDTTSFTYETRPNFVAKRPIYVTSVRVEEISPRIFDDDDFRIWYDHGGSLVSDHTHEDAIAGAGVEYIVPASEEELRRASEGSPMRRWLILANIIVIIVVFTVVSWKRMST